MKQSGFTLIELICTIVCLAILMVLSSASWIYYSVKIQREMAMRRVQQAMAYARSQAILQGVPIIYCGSADGKHCDGDWQHGQIIQVANETHQILQTYPAVNRVELSFHSNLGHNEQIEFVENGFTHGQNGHFEFCIKSAMPLTACKKIVFNH